MILLHRPDMHAVAGEPAIGNADQQRLRQRDEGSQLADRRGLEAFAMHVGGEEHSVSRTLTELETRLDPDMFFRAHRSIIVNLDRVKEVVPWFAGSHRLRLTTGAEVDLSRSRAKDLREILGL